jgi:uncharacterized protein involved in response to NO
LRLRQFVLRRLITDTSYFKALPLPFLSFGFRPFFFAASAFAMLSVTVWLLEIGGVSTFTSADWPPTFWHAHEMLFGFVGATVGGFLLTAVPNWTKTRPLSGAPLVVLLVLWLAGRFAMWSGGLAPPLVVAVIDLAFLPTLLAAIAPALLATRSKKHLLLLLPFTFLFIGNLAMHLAAMGITDGGFRYGAAIATNAIALLIATVGGRVVPAFTRPLLADAGNGAEVRATGKFDILCVLLVALVLITETFGAPAPLVGFAALVAGGFNAVRLVGWRPLSTLRWPTVWVLHLGFTWLVIGLIAKGLALSSGDPLLPGTAIHALTIGAFGTMILAIMTRAALGHTGRSTLPTGGFAVALSVAYLMISVGAVLRLATYWSGANLEVLLMISGSLWIAAFAIYFILFARILLGPRADAQAQSTADLR